MPKKEQLWMVRLDETPLGHLDLYFSAQGLEELGRYEIPTSLQLENRGMRETVVWRVLPVS